MKETGKQSPDGDVITIRLSDCCFAYEDIALDDFGRFRCNTLDDDGNYVLQCVEQRTLRYRFAPEVEFEMRGGLEGCFVARDVDGQEHLVTFYFSISHSEMAPITPGQIAAHQAEALKVNAMSEKDRVRHERQVAENWNRSRAQMMKEKFDSQKFRACQEQCKAEAREMMQRHGIARPLAPAKPKRKRHRSSTSVASAPI